MTEGEVWLHKSDIETSQVKLLWGDVRIASEYGLSPVGVLGKLKLNHHLFRT